MPKVSDLFHLDYGHSLELNRLKRSADSDSIRFVGRAARNNGVTARVEPIPGLQPASAGTITVALNGQGGAGVAFLQPFPYYTGFHVMVLTAKAPMSEQEKLWWVSCITANRFRFGFGRQANRTLKTVDLPDFVPSWVHSVDYVTPFSAILDQLKHSSSVPKKGGLELVGGSRARVDSLFDVSYGTSLELNRLCRDPGGVNFVARTAQNNGVVAKVLPPSDASPISPGCISVAVSGSVLESFVQQEPFLTGFHVMVLRPRAAMCLEEIMFYAECIRANQWRYSYGRQANRTLRELLLPAREAVPSWIFGSLARVSDRLRLATMTA